MKNWILGICALSGSLTALGQSISAGSITGNMEATFQYLNADSLIGATQPSEKGLLNSYMNVFYTNGKFKAGTRIESYLPRIQGYPNRFDGTGIGMRYAGYANDYIDITLGNFYEQFGSGISFRAYEDRNLGYDNAMDGVRLILRPIEGVQIKAIYGRQRYSFQGGKVIVSDGLTRGIDAQLRLNSFFHRMDSVGLDITLGGSFVSKYQADNNEEYILPENVGSYGGRFDIRFKKLTFNGEYIHKENDPSADNGYIYNSGHAALANLGYSKKGFGVMLSAKSVDNMSLRSDRTAGLQDLFINYLPAMNKTHTYNLVATLYPYATQPLGEIAYQGELLYNIPKGILGKYAVPINVNYSVAYMPNRSMNGIDITDSSRIMYKTSAFNMSDSLLWQDFNINATYKFNKNLYVIGSYYNIRINNDVSKITPDAHGIISTQIGVLELGWKINKKHNIRAEFQGLFNQKIYEKDADGTFKRVGDDKGNWATGVLEYTISPNWFFGIMDQFNYGNKDADLRLHYVTVSAGWIKESTRVTINYGKQRAGLFCVGGVCRFVPASNGLTLSVTHSF
ncbi:MAG: hypothetical protein IT221_11465 [Fluviicola sp.]|nr:hypothetical protein [Fluviicola sp.]